MANVRITRLDEATALNADDVMAVDGSGGTRQYRMETLKSEIVTEAKTETLKEVKVTYGGQAAMNPFNLDYVNMMTFNLVDGEGGAPREFTMPCDCMCRFGRTYYAKSSGAVTIRYTADVLSVNGVSMKDIANNVQYVFNSFSQVSNYYDLFLEAGDKIGMQTSYGAHYLNMIPLRHCNYDEDTVKTYDVYLSDLLTYEAKEGYTVHRDEILSSDPRWGALSAYFDGIDGSVNILDTYCTNNDTGKLMNSSSIWWNVKKEIQIMDGETAIAALSATKASLDCACRANAGHLVKLSPKAQQPGVLWISPNFGAGNPGTDPAVLPSSFSKSCLQDAAFKQFMTKIKNVWFWKINPAGYYHVYFPENQKFTIKYVNLGGQ